MSVLLSHGVGATSITVGRRHPDSRLGALPSAGLLLRAGSVVCLRGVCLAGGGLRSSGRDFPSSAPAVAPFAAFPVAAFDVLAFSAPPFCGRFFSTLRRSASMRSITSPPSGSAAVSPNVASVSTRVALLELASISCSQLLLVLVSVTPPGVKSEANDSTSASDISQLLVARCAPSRRARGTSPRAPRRPRAATAA